LRSVEVHSDSRGSDRFSGRDGERLSVVCACAPSAAANNTMKARATRQLEERMVFVGLVTDWRIYYLFAAYLVDVRLVSLCIVMFQYVSMRVAVDLLS
jgi:hypothetical protein